MPRPRPKPSSNESIGIRGVCTKGGLLPIGNHLDGKARNPHGEPQIKGQLGRHLGARGNGPETRANCDEDPSTLQCQTRYMINENVFRRYLPEFEGRGWTVHQYMVPAYYWLGWCIKGHRETYAYEYTKQLVLS